jgi:hypothetical protein
MNSFACIGLSNGPNQTPFFPGSAFEIFPVPHAQFPQLEKWILKFLLF